MFIKTKSILQQPSTDCNFSNAIWSYTNSKRFEYTSNSLIFCPLHQLP